MTGPRPQQRDPYEIAADSVFGVEDDLYAAAADSVFGAVTTEEPTAARMTPEQIEALLAQAPAPTTTAADFLLKTPLVTPQIEPPVPQAPTPRRPRRETVGPPRPGMSPSRAVAAAAGEAAPRRKYAGPPRPGMSPELALEAAADPRAAALAEELEASLPARIVQAEKVRAYASTLSVGQRVGNAANSFMQSAVGMSASALGGIAVLAKELDELFGTGSYEGKEAKELATAQAGEVIRRWAEKTFPDDPQLRGAFLDNVLPSAFGSGVTFLATGGAAAALRGSSLAAAGTLGSLVETGATYEEAKASGATEEVARKAAVWALPLGALEAIPAERQLNRFLNAYRGGKRGQILKAMVAGGGEEAVQEGIQTVGGNVIARTLYDSERDLLEDLGPSMGAGAIVGGVLSGGAAAVGQITGRKKDPEYKQLLEDIRRDPERFRQAGFGHLVDAVEAEDAYDAAADEVFEEPPAEPPAEKPTLRQRIADVVDPTRRTELEQAYRDPMTGLANPTAFQQAQPRMDADPALEIAALDVQNLKGINDIEGRAAADEFLAEVGRVTQEVAEERGFSTRDVFRAGGDEFAIAGPKGEVEAAAQEIVERIGQRQIGDTEFQTGLRMGVADKWYDADQAAQAVKEEEAGERFRPSPPKGVEQPAETAPVTPAVEPEPAAAPEPTVTPAETPTAQRQIQEQVDAAFARLGVTAEAAPAAEPAVTPAEPVPAPEAPARAPAAPTAAAERAPRPRTWKNLKEVPEGVETKRLAGGQRQEVISEKPRSVEVPKAEAVEAEPVTPQPVTPTEPAPSVPTGPEGVSVEGIPYSEIRAHPRPGWNTNLMKAREYAGALGIENTTAEGEVKTLERLVMDINTELAAQESTAPEGFKVEGFIEERAATEFESMDAAALDVMEVRSAISVDAPASAPAFRGLYRKQPDGAWLNERTGETAESAVLAGFLVSTAIAPAAAAPQISPEEAPSEAVRPAAPREPAGEPTGAAPRVTPEGKAAPAPKGRPAGRPADEGPGAEGPGGEPAVQPGAVEQQPGGMGGGARPDRGRAGAERPGTGGRPGRKPKGDRGATHAANYRASDAGALGANRSPKQKAKDNLTAIRLLKEIETAGRPATREEQQILAQYAGWGFAKTVFEPDRKTDFTEQAVELRELLTDDEYDSARRSVLNAHFTDPAIVIKMWEALQHMGFKGGRLLEPGMGAGYFWSLIPQELAGTTRLSGVELDLITGRIAKLLFPKADVRVQGFEEFQIPDDYYVAAMTNVPFGEYRPFDPKYQKHRFTIHNYFFAKTLDKVQPGGVIAFITSRYTMDSKTGVRMRQYLAERADLLGAIRLPNTAFKKVANTTVTTDIIFLRKRHPGEPVGGESWTDLGSIDVAIPEKARETYAGAPTEQTLELNEYFVQHPEMMLGTMELTGTQYRADEPTLAPKEGNLADQMAEAIEALPRDVMVPEDVGTDADMPQTILAPDTVKEGAFVMEGGKLMRRQSGVLVPARNAQGKAYTGVTLKRIKALTEIRDATRAVLRTQLTDESDADIHKRQADLTKVYDRFVRRFGPINQKSGARRLNLEGFRDDPDLQLVANLENIQLVDEEERFVKADLFTQRVLSPPKPIQHAEKPEDALMVVLNERGRVDLDRMAEITDFTRDELIDRLKGRLFQDPQTNEWEASELYLSGNVRAKLVAAKGAALEDDRYESNVKALEAVQPEDLPPTTIEPSMGAPWIPAEDIEQFIADLVNDGEGQGVHVAYSEPIATWIVRVDPHIRGRPRSTREWGTERRPFPDLVRAVLNQQEIKVTDRDSDGHTIPNAEETLAAQAKVDDIKKRFRDWVWEEPKRATRLHRVYNDDYNNTVPYKPDGVHMTFPGMAKIVNGKPFKFYPHQPDAIWRVLQTGNTLLAHAVGSGKTFVMTAAGMEAKRIGLAKKPMYVVPNKILEQFGREFLQLYPAARVLVASKKDLQKENRRAFMAKVANNEWDAVIMAQSSFTLVPVSPAFEERFIRGEMSGIAEALIAAQLEAQAEGSRAMRSLVRSIELAKERLETRLKELENRDRKDDVLSFEEMGIDMLFVDESHNYKNLYAPSKQRSLGGGKPVQKALDMYMKVSYLNERTPGRGTVFATGTPLSRSIVEMYTLLRYLAPAELASRGMKRLDAWAAGFAESATKIELRPEGGFRNYTRLSHFKNAPELSQLFLTIADVQTAEMLNLPTPTIRGGQAEVVVAPMSDELSRYQSHLQVRADAIRRGQVRPEDDNMLLLTHDGDRAALDMRLIDPRNPDHPDSKVNTAVDRIFKIWDETKDTRRTQLVFIDWSTPKSGFNIYDDMKAKLLARGIPEKEIAYIHNAKNPLAEAELQAKMRAGVIRVLLGSTAKMGEGVNIQDRLIALHNLDAPWNPSHIEQRDGRGLRQGNTNDEIEIIRYTTEGSFDGYRWQTLARKARFIAQIVRAEVTSRTIEDVDGREFTFAEVMAITTGNPLVLEKAQVDNDVLRLSALSRQHTNRQFDMRRDLAIIPDRIAARQKNLDAATADKKTVVDVTGKKFTITLQGQTYTKRADAGKALMDIVHKLNVAASSKQVGNFAGFTLSVREALGAARFSIQGKDSYEAAVQLGSTDAGAIQTVEYLPNRIQTDLMSAEGELSELKRRVKDLKDLVGKPFDQQEQLDKLLVRQVKIDQTLDLDRPPPDEILGDDDPNAPDDEQPQAPEFMRIDSEAVEPGDPSPKGLSEVKLEESVSKPPGLEMPSEAYGASLFDLARELETPARYKHLRSAYGRFQPREAEGEIELMDVNDIFGLAHEVSHALDYRLSGDVFPSSIKARFGQHVPSGITEEALRGELAMVAQMMRPVPGNQLPKYRRKHTELMADYYSLYLLNPDHAASIAPNVTEAFQGRLSTRPKVQDPMRVVLQRLAEAGPAVTVPEIRPVGQPTSLIPDDIEGGYTEAAKALAKGVPRTYRLRKAEAGKRAQRWSKALTDEELENVGAAAENIGNLRTGLTAEEVQDSLTPEQKKVLREYRHAQEHLRQTLNEFMRDIHGDDYVAYVEDYLLHVYVRDRQMARKYASRWARRVPSAKARRFPTLQEAVEEGFTPLTQNVADLHKLWAEMNWRGAINQRFVFELKGMVNEDGLPVLMKPRDAPPEWPVVDHPAIRRVYARKLPSGAVELWHGGAAIDPEVYKATRQVFEEPFGGRIVRIVEMFNAFAKKAALSFSLFHHWALTESAQGALARLWNPLRGIVMIERGLRGGIPLGFGVRVTTPHREGLRLMENADFIRDVTMHGVNIDPVPDVMAGHVRRALAEAEVKVRRHPVLGKIPGLEYLVRAARRFNAGWDHLLWERYYTGLKAMTYYELVKEQMSGMPDDATPADIRGVKEKVATLVNDMFGGQEWEGKFWLTPKGRQIMHWLILAPDWTLSNIQVAAKTILPGTDPTTRRILLRYWRNILGTLFGMIATAGLALTRKWPWENEPGHKLDINITPIMVKLPWTSEADKKNGRQWYIKPGKQVREPLRYLENPINIAGAKVSPLAHILLEQVTGHQAGQWGWDMPWVREEMGWYESLPSRLVSVMEKFVPFAFRGSNFGFTFPMSRGMSWYKGQKAYEEVIRAQVDPSLFRRLMPGKDAERLKKEIDDAATLNGLDPKELYKQANTMVRTKYYGLMWRALEAKNMREFERLLDILTQLGVTSETVEASGERRGLPPETIREARGKFPSGRRRGPQPPRPPRPPSPPRRR